MNGCVFWACCSHLKGEYSVLGHVGSAVNTKVSMEDCKLRQPCQHDNALYSTCVAVVSQYISIPLIKRCIILLAYHTCPALSRKLWGRKQSYCQLLYSVCGLVTECWQALTLQCTHAPRPHNLMYQPGWGIHVCRSPELLSMVLCLQFPCTLSRSWPYYTASQTLLLAMRGFPPASLCSYLLPFF